jgi:hypothetical protein
MGAARAQTKPEHLDALRVLDAAGIRWRRAKRIWTDEQGQRHEHWTRRRVPEFQKVKADR